MTKSVVLVLACSLLSATGAIRAQEAVPQATAAPMPWTIGPRALPVPAGASDALRGSLMRVPPPDVAGHVRDAPATAEDWARLLDQASDSSGDRTRAFAKAWSTTISEDEIAGVTVRTVTPPTVDPANKNRLFVHLHGGAYVFGSGVAGASEAIMIARYSKMPVLSIDYRMPPAHPFPAALDDVIAVWRSLLKDRKASSLALGGSSAGGGLVLAVTQELQDLGLDLPGALWAGSPWADLTKTGDSQFINEGIDRMLVTYDGILAEAAKLYAGGRDLRTPLISPVYGEFEGFPPTYLVTGTRDLFLSHTARVHRKLRAAGVIADLNVYEGMSHLDFMVELHSPESQEVYGALGVFLTQHLEEPVAPR
ncbi:MAG: alpha/beta hydrolase fold domain-containing protein [Acidobacteriota bacterium]